jgi:hypothetical protein
MRRPGRWIVVGVLQGVLLLLHGQCFAASPTSETKELREEIRRLKEENERNHQRMEELERKVEQLETKEEQKQKAIEGTVAKEVEKQTATAPRRYLERYWGTNRFVLTGWGGGTYEWDRNANTSTFTATFDPVFLFRVTDRVLFEAESEFGLKDDGTTEVNLEYAQADILLNNYATLVGGKFLTPFGEFIQQLHPGWINKLVSFPLPFRENEEGGLIPFSDVGVQVRGGAELFKKEGVGLDYALFVSNGPHFDSNKVGAKFVANNVDVNHGKGFGARLAAYPLPLSLGIGRLKVGASTYNGTWDPRSNLWFTSWGIDGAYQLDEFELRGEYLSTRREMPSGISADDRNGWYLQGAYKLARLGVSHLNRMELVSRYSGVNQRAVTDKDLLAHPRQVALGLDYWLTPSVVGKLEYDRELPEHAPHDHAVRGQIAVGF